MDKRFQGDEQLTETWAERKIAKQSKPAYGLKLEKQSCRQFNARTPFSNVRHFFLKKKTF